MNCGLLVVVTLKCYPFYNLHCITNTDIKRNKYGKGQTILIPNSKQNSRLLFHLSKNGIASRRRT